MNGLKEHGYVTCDTLLEKPLLDLGWVVETVPWDKKGADWKQYEVVILRTTWDYQDRLGEFLSRLRFIAQATVLHNPISVVQWNCDKHYLGDIAARNCPIVPTIFPMPVPNKPYRRRELMALFDELRCDEIVVKPAVSASAHNTIRIQRRKSAEGVVTFVDCTPVKLVEKNATTTSESRPCDAESTLLARIAEAFSSKGAPSGWIAQRFEPSISVIGELSLLFFCGNLSHVVAKVPASGDFRVQEQYGGHNQLVSEPAPDLVAAAHKVLEAIPSEVLQDPVTKVVRPLMYSRVDLVQGNDADGKPQWELMELELVEPSLYLNMSNEAPANFVRGFVESVQSLKK